MTNKELIELAAKAAGIKGRWGTQPQWDDLFFIEDSPQCETFDPLNDNADAFDLAVKLHLDINMSDDPSYIDVSKWCTVYVSDYNKDRAAALRYGITYCAAYLGREMK